MTDLAKDLRTLAEIKHLVKPEQAEVLLEAARIVVDLGDQVTAMNLRLLRTLTEIRTREMSDDGG